MTGAFITFEGGEGSGKTTQIEKLATRLRALGHKIVKTREPGGTPHAENIRAFILSGKASPYGVEAEALMFNAARIDHIDNVIAQALARNEIVLCDRFADSTRAYQGASGNIADQTILELERIVVADCRPHLTFIFDLEVTQGLARANRRRNPNERADRFESELLDFHEKIRENFLKINNSEPERCRLIDASKTIEEIHSLIVFEIETRMRALRI